MKNWRIGAWIITLVALVTIIGPFVADWNATHIYNPRRTPHAKFHNAQTMLLGLGLGERVVVRVAAKRRRQNKSFSRRSLCRNLLDYSGGQHHISGNGTV